MTTEDEIRLALRNTSRDLQAYKEAYGCIMRRVQELEESDKLHLKELMSWAGFQVVVNALKMVIVRCEGLVEDYNNLLENLRDKTLN